MDITEKNELMENTEQISESTKKKRGTRIEQIQARQVALQKELQEVRKKENEYKNKEALKIWKKIKYLFIDSDILPKISDKDFVDEIGEKIAKIVEEYKPKKEKVENNG